MEKKKKDTQFPYGLSNLEKLITEGHAFVDKTPFIPLLEAEGSQIAFLRPRRIGKSLFVSILEYYYDINQKHKFDKLFGAFHIGKNPTPLANSFHILKMDFSGIETSTHEKSYNGFLGKIKSYLNYFMSVYGLFDKETRAGILAAATPALTMKSFFDTYKSQNADGPKIYLIIDEYDHFTNEILIRDLSEFKSSVSQDGYVRKFYELIKEATQQGLVDRFFITGVSPMTLDGLTSGFNIVTHLTKSERFHDMMGFTEPETKSLLAMVLEDANQSEAIIGVLRDYYNGYRFHRKAAHTVYNSDMVLYFLNEFKHAQEYPMPMLDPNIMPDYGKLQKMFEVANWQDNIAVLETILREGEIASEMLYQFNFERVFGRREFVNFLYYMGNLTIKEENIAGVPVFKIPNKVIADLYWSYYAHVIQQRAELDYEEDRIQPAVIAMALGDPAPFFALIERNLAILSNRDFSRFDEKYIKMLIVAYAMQGSVFHIVSERETDAGGYIDVEMYVRPNNSKQHHQYVLEIKYLKKEEESFLKKQKAAAAKQLRGYLAGDELLKSKNKLHALVVAVVKDKVYWEELSTGPQT